MCARVAQQVGDGIDRRFDHVRLHARRSAPHASANAAGDPAPTPRTPQRCRARAAEGRAPAATIPCRTLRRSSSRRAADAARECSHATDRTCRRTPSRRSRSPSARQSAGARRRRHRATGRAESRRHSRIAFSVRGNPANRYVCSTNSSTQTAGISSAPSALPRGCRLRLPR